MLRTWLLPESSLHHCYHMLSTCKSSYHTSYWLPSSQVGVRVFPTFSLPRPSFSRLTLSHCDPYLTFTFNTLKGKVLGPVIGISYLNRKYPQLSDFRSWHSFKTFFYSFQPPSEEIKTGEDEDEEDNDALLKENESKN